MASLFQLPREIVLQKYNWPENVRELKNCVERACCFASTTTITVADLPPKVGGVPRPVVVALRELEKRSIYEALDLAAGDKRAAAKLLGIGKTTLYRKLKEYDSETLGK